ncbi:MAG: hypothetical protein M1368_00945 [Thaumarchaeota archaeon]|nr:hypothetical protein [Nitrososphaerota archaeon]
MSSLVQAVAVFLEYDLTLILLLICIGIFGYLAAKSKSVRTFRFQICVFILIWIAGEFVNTLLESRIISVPPSMQELGYEIHVASMVFFAVLLYARYFYASGRGRELIEDVEE